MASPHDDIVAVGGDLEPETLLMAYRRGSFTILDHRGLVAAACGCYKKINDVYSRAQGRKDLSHQNRRSPARNRTNG